MHIRLTLAGNDLNINSKLTASGVKFPNADEKDGTKHNRFAITIDRMVEDLLYHSDEKMVSATKTFSYYGSQADYEAHKTDLTEEELKQALRCIIEDANSGTMDFKEFCSEFGYDTDSRRAEKIYNACKNSLMKVRDLGFFDSELIDALNELQEQGIE